MAKRIYQLDLNLIFAANLHEVPTALIRPKGFRKSIVKFGWKPEVTECFLLKFKASGEGYRSIDWSVSMNCFLSPIFQQFRALDLYR